MKTVFNIERNGSCDRCGNIGTVLELYRKAAKGENVNQMQWLCLDCLRLACMSLAHALDEEAREARQNP